VNRRQAIARFDRPLELDSGQSLPCIDVAYETYGTLNNTKDNAVLVLHGLTGTQHGSRARSPARGRGR